ncbi:phasin family protein [Campylobacter geochelonis]|uniref:phasin family protein n=1 Tax=Campylobacter geochelonis TaxID=1780362 RepID=UPI0007707F25|nr:hypothetical protein [Campylobacter geochelonis]CZE51065.1 Uncharacterized conserved protein [Campylobacter geochelonis]
MLKDMLYIGLGGFMEVKERVEKELKALEEKGKLSKDDSKAFLKNLYDKGEEEHNRHYELMTKALKDVIGELELATKDDIKNLEKKIDEKL